MLVIDEEFCILYILGIYQSTNTSTMSCFLFLSTATRLSVKSTLFTIIQYPRVQQHCVARLQCTSSFRLHRRM